MESETTAGGLSSFSEATAGGPVDDVDVPDRIGTDDLLRPVAEGDGRSVGTFLAGRRGQVFGGQVAAHALWAAGRAVPGLPPPHSMHVHFLSPGDASGAAHYTSTVLKRGRAFTVVRVDVEQRDRLLAAVTVSFHVPEAGPEHALPAPVIAAPAESPGLDTARIGGPSPVWQPVEARLPADPVTDGNAPRLRLWKRWATPLPDDPLAHACAFTWMSDLSMVRTAALFDGVPFGTWTAASLDHVVWFHRPMRADQWLLFDLVSTVRASSRALTHGDHFDVSGMLMATAEQECLLRLG